MAADLELEPLSDGTLHRSATTCRATVDLHWIPLGAGGHSVRFNGKVFEAISSLIDGRPRCEIYHSALTIHVPDGFFTVEMTPIPDRRGWQRGVVAEGAVGSRWAGNLRIFRYEIRCWRDGVIPDLRFTPVRPARLTDMVPTAERILEVLPSVPRAVWAGTSCEPARCGAATRSSPGHSPAPASTRNRSHSRRVAEHRDGRPGSSSRNVVVTSGCALQPTDGDERLPWPGER
jgi:hypothetical protein